MSPAFAIDARAATEEGAGGGRVVRELLRALGRAPDDHRYLLYARDAWPEPLDERFEWRLDPARDPVWHVRAARDANARCAAFLSTNSYLTVWFLRVPAVPIVFDLVAFDRSLRPQLRSGMIERLTLPLAARRAESLLAISCATARDLERRFPVVAGKVTVAHLASAPLERTDSAAPPADVPESAFVLAVGTLEPRKNLPRLVEAYRRLPAALQERHPLVVTGRPGWAQRDTLRALESLGDRAIQTGFVPDATLRTLYERCAVFVYPSLGEGFGLPVLEAMAAGAPVLTSNRSSLPEVGGSAAAYCDPTDVDAIASALRGLLAGGAELDRLRAAGPKRAAEFSWDRTAAIVRSTLERAATPRAGGRRRRRAVRPSP